MVAEQQDVLSSVALLIGLVFEYSIRQNHTLIVFINLKRLINVINHCNNCSLKNPKQTNNQKFIL